VTLIFLPLAVLLVQTILPGGGTAPETGRVMNLMFRSFGFAAVIGAAAVLLGYIPGKLFGTARRGRYLFLLLLLMPLVLPRYVLYYAWSLLLSPVTSLGIYLSGRMELSRMIGLLCSSSVLVSWYWPLAALLIGQGWRGIDREICDSTRLEAGIVKQFFYVTLPLLWPSLLLAFTVCFILSLSEFTTFHLAGVQTVGTELAVLYELTGSEQSVARAAWPIAVAALAAAIVLGKSVSMWNISPGSCDTVEIKSQKLGRSVFILLLIISIVAPLLLLIANISDTQAFAQFFRLHSDELAWSILISIVAAVIAHLIALCGLSLDRFGRAGVFFSSVVYITIFSAMFMPASLVAVTLLKILSFCDAASALRASWFVVSMGQAIRFSGVALIMLMLGRGSERKHLSEMAAADGASWFQMWRHIHFPRLWPIFTGSVLLIVMLGVTEISATMVLLPAGLPNFAQTLLNQMHYARDQQVIASTLALICVFFVLVSIVVVLLRLVTLRRLSVLMLCVSIFIISGCDESSGDISAAKVLYSFGQTGRGRGEFIYPRAIDISGDGTVYVADKTGRIQRLSSKGEFFGVLEMPLIAAGKPVGLSLAPNGELYVADTHYHRVVIFDTEGRLVKEFGRFGQKGGEFIYPTDVAFTEDGRILVSEYGGNDRISVFNEQGEFLSSFADPGSGEVQLSRPSALCVDSSRKCFYVADACNHRIAVYDLDGSIQKYIGTVGRAKGQLRYPYDLALMGDGTIVVCEYGNNRIQLFRPDGKSLGVYGRAGREPGELAYPWGVAVDGRGRGFIVDAGNNRIQIWQL
jgi:ABC-type Fe3+ transport system permease subunit/DNA-binding beta-propeller fold protein YncE